MHLENLLGISFCSSLNPYIKCSFIQWSLTAPFGAVSVSCVNPYSFCWELWYNTSIDSMEVLINRPFVKTHCKNYVVSLKCGVTIALVCISSLKRVENYWILIIVCFFQVLKSCLPYGKYESVVQRANIQSVCCYCCLLKCNVHSWFCSCFLWMYVTAIPLSFLLILETFRKYIFLSLLHG